jgi:hypothetical protein
LRSRGLKKNHSLSPNNALAERTRYQRRKNNIKLHEIQLIDADLD